MCICSIRRKWQGVVLSLCICPSDVKRINRRGFSPIFHFTADSGDKWRKKALATTQRRGPRGRSTETSDILPLDQACVAFARRVFAYFLRFSNASLWNSCDAWLISLPTIQMYRSIESIGIFHKPFLRWAHMQAGTTFQISLCSPLHRRIDRRIECHMFAFGSGVGW